MTDSRCLCIIPARGGSKGVPGKNLRAVGGIPLVTRAIATARQARCAPRVVVSTDSERIAAEAQRGGAEVFSRPADLAGDTASSESALLHVLSTLHESGQPAPQILLFVQCTSPFLSAADIDGVHDLVASGQFDTAFTAARTHAFLWRLDGVASGVNHDPTARLRRQDRPVEYVETGGAYAMGVPGFVAHRHRFFGRIGLHEVSALSAIEIDDEQDLLVAEAINSVGTNRSTPKLRGPL